MFLVRPLILLGRMLMADRLVLDTILDVQNDLGRM